MQRGVLTPAIQHATDREKPGHTFGSAKTLMTFPRASNERLMLAPSLNRAPFALVALARSEPARSMRHILATFTLGFRLAVFSCCLR